MHFVQGTDDLLGGPFCDAEHGGRVHRLVARNQQELRNAALSGNLRADQRSENVCLDRRFPVFLEQRDVLERGGMKDDARLELADDAGHLAAVRHIDDAALEAIVVPFADILVELENSELRYIGDQNCFGSQFQRPLDQ